MNRRGVYDSIRRLRNLNSAGELLSLGQRLSLTVRVVIKCPVTVGAIFWWLAATGFAAEMNFAQAADVVDLSISRAIPSDGGAILLNPAALAGVQTTLLDLGVRQNSGQSTDVAGIFTAGKGSLGYGLELQNLANKFVPSAGFAASANKFSVGVSATLDDSTTVTLGFRQELSQYVVALVFPDVGNLLKNWTLGFGIPVKNFLRFGFDFNFANTDSTVGISRSQLAATAEIYSSRTYSFILSYQVSVESYPGNSF